MNRAQDVQILVRHGGVNGDYKRGRGGDNLNYFVGCRVKNCCGIMSCNKRFEDYKEGRGRLGMGVDIV